MLVSELSGGTRPHTSPCPTELAPLPSAEGLPALWARRQDWLPQTAPLRDPSLRELCSDRAHLGERQMRVLVRTKQLEEALRSHDPAGVRIAHRTS